MAAAYAALVSVLNDLEDIQNHPIHSFSFDDNQIQSLSQSVTFLIDFMQSYDNCYGPSKEAAQLLENDITIAAQAAEEVIESHVANQINGGSTLGGKKKRSPRFLLDLEKVNQDMDYMRRKAIKVQEARSGLDLKQSTYSAADASSSSSTQPDLTSEKTTMVGFDELLDQLLYLLTGYPSSRQVIPIVGTGGIGKTTLARNAFDHEFIVQHFDFCLWATISQQYVVQDILSTLLSRQPKSNSENVGELGVQLHKMLYGRRYLIVLDDMWSVGAWEEVQRFFPDTNGSQVVVTTRLSDLANKIGSVSPLAVSLLDDHKSWDLFCQKAFAAGEGCPLELEGVGKSIVRKCKGLPLAIIVVAGHLGKSSRRQEYWVNVENNMKSVLNSEENDQFFNILSFSYTHLPAHLKPCFVYMGTFPEDEEIYVRDLIRCWIADGFLRSCRGDNLEEIAKDYLKDLIDRNLILDIPSESPFKEDRCKIHDVLRELCLKVAEKEMFFYMDDTHSRRRPARFRERRPAVCRERRVGIREKVGEENHHPEIFDAARVAPPQLVRSVELHRREWHSFDLRLCRVMRKELSSDVNVPVPVPEEADFQHANLRYLHYNIDGGRESDPSLYLPSSISRFWNLQTLIIQPKFFRSSCSLIAPIEIWEMVQLRHLEVGCITFDKTMGINLPDPVPSDKLEEANDELVMRNLHTLMAVENFKFSEEVCRRVPNVKELRVSYFSSEASPLYYCPHNLGYLRKLESLELNIPNALDSGWREFALSLTFPSSLKELTLRGGGCRLDWEEMTTMVGSLPHLQTLILFSNAVVGSEWTLVEGIKFPSLKTLTISDCRDLAEWKADDSHFPVLENLYLTEMPRMDEIPSDIGTIPTLRSIRLILCSVSLAISAVRIVVKQEEDGNEDLRLHVSLTNKEVDRFKKQMEEEDNGENQTVSNKKCNAGEEQINDLQVKQALKMQMDVQRKLHQQIEVQRHLQLRIEAQGRYLQSVLKKAEETLSGYSACSIEVEHARAQLSQLASMVDSGCTNSSFSVLTDSDCSMLKEAGEKVLGRNGNGCSLESSLTSSETSEGKEEAQPNNEMNLVSKRSKSAMDEGEDYRVRKKMKKNIIDLNELDSGPTPRGIDLNCNFASTF